MYAPTHIYIYIYMYAGIMYIYIYIEREREIDGEERARCGRRAKRRHEFEPTNKD